VLHEPRFNDWEHLVYHSFSEQQIEVSVMIRLAEVFTKDDHPMRVRMLRQTCHTVHVRGLAAKLR
jgi:hypothetical protein